MCVVDEQERARKELEVENLYNQIKACRVCESFLPLGANPVLTMSAHAKILVVGQAPGIKVHRSGIPWDDQSGRELRNWLGVTDEEFYNPLNFAILPMGLCYPGKGDKGDLPPRRECAPLWHEAVIQKMTELELVLLVGKYAQAYYLKDGKKNSLTDNVRTFRQYLPFYFPLPHPSPRNFIWKARNPWFKEEVIPELQDRVRLILSTAK